MFLRILRGRSSQSPPAGSATAGPCTQILARPADLDFHESILGGLISTIKLTHWREIEQSTLFVIVTSEDYLNL